MDTKISSDEQSKSTRQRVLQTMLAHQRCTINELAEAVDINPISVRHHITRLEADGLVASTEERHGVGRPRRVYFLTEAGREQFPTRYLRLTTKLLGQLKESMPKPMVDRLFAEIARDMAADYELAAAGLSMEERLNLVTQLLGQEGFSVEWEKKEGEYHIREINCPYLHVGQNHPEVCSLDQTLISTMLAVPAEKVKCVLNGDSFCTYVVPAVTNGEQ
ncbi:MAG: winged helix-turn-helix transcriptional regulator [Anaerolineales bacterium]|nr:winged helix-turn-helix transcriptional regulator [Anaerolineales bacterium]